MLVSRSLVTRFAAVDNTSAVTPMPQIFTDTLRDSQEENAVCVDISEYLPIFVKLFDNVSGNIRLEGPCSMYG